VHHLTDVASVAFFALVLGLVATGSAPLQRLLGAFRVADRSRGGVRKPGAIFAATWSGWTPPPLPSAIDRPAYYQAPVPPPPPPPPPPDGADDELAELERLVAVGGPVARLARARLAEFRVGVAAEGRPTEAAPQAQEGRHVPASRPARSGPVVGHPVGRRPSRIESTPIGTGRAPRTPRVLQGPRGAPPVPSYLARILTDV
jgi:hypothetical protein